MERLPRYAPGLNDIEWSWRDLKRRHLARHTFKGATDPTCAVYAAVRQLNKERMNAHSYDNLEKPA